jgi:hypothetical protein
MRRSYTQQVMDSVEFVERQTVGCSMHSTYSIDQTTGRRTR